MYNYSTLSSYFTSQTNVTPSSIATCKSIGNATTNKVYHVLFDSGFSKALVYKCIVPQNFTPIQSLDDLWIFSLAGTTTSIALVALAKISFPKFNHNVVVDEHPTLIVDFMSLHYDIIFGANFLDKYSIILDYNSNLVHWMEYYIPLHNASEFFPTVITLLY